MDRIRTEGLGDLAHEPPVVAPGRLVSFAERAHRIIDGSDRLLEVRDALDQAQHGADADLADLMVEEPAPTGDARADALLAAIAEHVAVRRGLRPPAWVLHESRFLDHFWFVSKVEGFRAVAIAQSPMALKRRGIFWPARSLQRV